MRAASLLWFGIAAAALAGAGCTSAAQDHGAQVIIPVGPEKQDSEKPLFRGKAIDPVLDEILSKLQMAAESRDDARFQALLESARQMNPPSFVNEFLDQLTSLVRGRDAARALEGGAHVEAVRDQVTMGDPVSLQLVLENRILGDRGYEIVIPRKTGGGLFSGRPAARTQLLAYVKITDFDAYGGEAAMTNSVPVVLREDIRVNPGETYRMDFQLEGAAPRASVARTIEIGAELLPCELRVDGSVVVFTKLQFAAAKIVALPPGYESSAADPVASLEQWLEKPEAAAERSILPAAMLVPAESRDRALRVLARKLFQSPPGRQRAIIAALRRITGDRERGLETGPWLGWASSLLADR